MKTPNPFKLSDGDAKLVHEEFLFMLECWKDNRKFFSKKRDNLKAKMKGLDIAVYRAEQELEKLEAIRDKVREKFTEAENTCGKLNVIRPSMERAFEEVFADEIKDHKSDKVEPPVPFAMPAVNGDFKDNLTVSQMRDMR